jgi:hypothetical protein
MQSLYLLDAQGECRWQVEIVWNFAARSGFAVGPDGSITLSDANHLLFLNTDGTPAAPALALPVAAGADPDWSWRPNPTGGAFVRLRSAANAAEPHNWVYAVSAVGQGFWRVEVPLDFELLCATDTGFVYGLQHKEPGGGPSRGTFYTDAELVCLLVLPPAT